MQVEENCGDARTRAHLPGLLPGQVVAYIYVPIVGYTLSYACILRMFVPKKVATGCNEHLGISSISKQHTILAP